MDQPGFAPETAEQKGSARRLALFGLLMLLPAVYFAWRYPLLSHAHELTDLGKLARYGRVEFVAYVGGLGLMFVLYLLALREARVLPARRTLPIVFGCGSLLALIMVAMYPVNAIDLFLYAVRSRLLTTYGANPSAALPRDFPDDPWRPLITEQWAQQVSPYGPLWNLIAAPVTYVAGDRVEVALLGFKLLAAVCVLLGGIVIARSMPDRAQASAALLYVWNPLVLWEGIGNAHNDVVMVVPLLLALWAWRARRDGLVIPMLVVAALIKYIALLLVPLAAVALLRRSSSWQERARIAAWSVGLSVVWVILALAPFFDLQALLQSLRNQGDIFTSSPATVVLGLLRQRFPDADVRGMIKLVGNGIVLVAVLGAIWATWAHQARLTRACFEGIFIFLLVATWNFRAWYVIWPLALAALLPWGWPAWRAVAWSIGGLAGYAYYIWIEAWTKTDFWVDHSIGVPVMFVPVLLVTVAEVVSYARRRRLPDVPIAVEQAR